MNKTGINKFVVSIYKIIFICQKMISKIHDPGSISIVESILITVGLKRSSRAKEKKIIIDIKAKLYNLGFDKRGPLDLKKMIKDHDNPLLQRLAVRELALWFAGKHDAKHTKMCLELVDQEFNREKDPILLRRTAIMKAECHEMLSDHAQAREALDKALAVGLHADLFFAYANLEDSLKGKIIWINKALALHGISGVTLDDFEKKPVLDCLKPDLTLQKKKRLTPAAPKISVIMPVYNAQGTIRTSLKAILTQTWTNLELLVIDDASNEETVSIVKEYAKKDARIKLFINKKNSGPYVARNRALQEAKGEYVTCHDADDWSHPELLERQALHLWKNRSVIGNISQQVRTTPDLKFIRRDRYGILMTKNFPSFMFRRQPVGERLGFWDCVRFSADHELIRRIEKEFGEKSIVNLATGPLCFQREHPASLTGHRIFGTKGHYMGARKEYYEAQTHYHDTALTLYYDFPQEPRLFPVPEPIRINREEKPGGYRLFHVVIASDFRLDGAQLLLNLDQIKAHLSKSCKIGLIQICRYDVPSDRPVSAKVRDFIDGEKVQMLVYGEKISCNTLIINHFPALLDWQKYIPEVKAVRIDVIIDELPGLDLEKGGYNELIYLGLNNFKRYFKKQGLLHPIDQATRKALMNFCELSKEPLSIAEIDWR